MTLLQQSGGFRGGRWGRFAQMSGRNGPIGLMANLNIVNRNGNSQDVDHLITGIPIKQTHCPTGSKIVVKRSGGSEITSQMLSSVDLASDHPNDPSGTVFCGIAISPGDTLADDGTLTLEVHAESGSRDTTPPNSKSSVITDLDAVGAYVEITNIDHPTNSSTATENTGTWRLELEDCLDGTERSSGATGGYGSNPVTGYDFIDRGVLVDQVRAFGYFKRTSDNARHKHLMGVFFARYWHADGHVTWDCLIVNNSTLGPISGHVGSSSPEQLRYHWEVGNASGSISSGVDLVHYLTMGWWASESTDNGRWLGGDPDVLAYLDETYMHGTEHFPAYRYDCKVRDGATEVSDGEHADEDYAPLSTLNYQTSLNTTGDRWEIGWFTTYGAKALIRPADEIWRKACRIRELAMAHLPTFDYNEATGFPILSLPTDGTNYPHLGTGSVRYQRPDLGSGHTQIEVGDDDAGPWSGYLDGCSVMTGDHLASIHVGYTLEADPRLLEIMQSQVIRLNINSNPSQQNFDVDNNIDHSTGYFRITLRQGGGQDRDKAWQLRQQLACDYLQPRDHPLAAYIRNYITNNYSYAAARYPKVAAVSDEYATFAAVGHWTGRATDEAMMNTFQGLHLFFPSLMCYYRRQTGWSDCHDFISNYQDKFVFDRWAGRSSVCRYYADYSTTIRITENGRLRNVFCSGTGTTTTIPFPASASAVDDFYNDWVIEFTQGPADNDIRTITDYNGSTKTATVNTAMSEAPTASSRFTCEKLLSTWAEMQTADMVDHGQTCPVPDEGFESDFPGDYLQELRILFATAIAAGYKSADAQSYLTELQENTHVIDLFSDGDPPFGGSVVAYGSREMAEDPKLSEKVKA